MSKITRFVATKQCNTNKENLSKIEIGSSYTKVNTTYCQPSNLTPHFWNYKIIDKEGSPDLPCILLLSEVFGWFRSLTESTTYYSKGGSLPEMVNGKLAISYDFLAEKLNFQKERIRRNFIKLEKLGVLLREVSNIALEDGSRFKQLYLSIDNEFFASCFRNPETDIRVRDNKFAASDSSAFKDTPLSRGEHIRNKNKTRSMISNSLESDLEEIKNIETNEQFKIREEGREDKQNSLAANKPLLQQGKAKQLEDFYPLTKEDCSLLQSKSGREFSLNAMNEILKDMAKKVTKAEFWSKKGFIAYMSQAFKYEMRDSVVVSNETFKIRANQNESEKEAQAQENYLTELENSLQVSPEWHLKKKLASVLERSKAYNLLTSYKKLEIEQGGNCKLVLHKPVELSSFDKEIILNQIQATHEQMGEGGDYTVVESLEILSPEKKSLKSYQEKVTKKTREESKIEPKESIGMWGRVRQLFTDSFGDHGKAIDDHWLSRLSANIDQDNNKIELKAENESVKNYIEDRLWPVLSKAAEQSGFGLTIKKA